MVGDGRLQGTLDVATGFSKPRPAKPVKLSSLEK
jgi:hypothetical protein